MNLPKFAVNHPVTTLMIFFGVLLLGIFSFTQLPLDMLPEIELPVISVITPYPGAGAEDVEEKVTKPLEDRLTTVPEIKHINSVSRDGYSVVTLMFEWGTDLDTRSNEVREAISFAERDLPEDVEKALVMKFDISKFPIMFFGVTGEESFSDLRAIVEDRIAEPLERVPGVGAVSVMGGLEKQVNIRFDRDRLAAHGLAPADIAAAISAENQNIPAGDIKVGTLDFIVRVPGEFEDTASMGDIVLSTRGGSTVRLRDVATVEDSFKERTLFARLNGRNAVVFMLQKQSGANTVKVAGRVKRELAELVKDLPGDVEVFSFMDNSEDIVRTLRDLTRALALGGTFAMLVVLFFLRRLRGAFIIALTIPFSLVIGVIAANLLGYTINMITLFAATIAIGMVIDNAIVVIENIARHREEGERPKEAAAYGASEVALAVTASTLTTVSIFLPLVLVRGLVKIFFGEFAVLLCVMVLGSLFSALTLTPALSSRLLGESRGTSLDGVYARSEKWFNALSHAYSRFLTWALEHRAIVLSCAAVVFLGSMPLVKVIGRELFPEEDLAILVGNLTLSVGTRVEKTDEVMRAIEKILEEEVRPDEGLVRFVRCGTTPGAMASSMGQREGPHTGFFGVKLVQKTERVRGVKEIAEGIRRRIDDVAVDLGIERFNLTTTDPMADLMLGGGRPVVVDILGEDFEKTGQVAAAVKGIVEDVRGTTDVDVSRQEGAPELWVVVDRQKASSMGLSVSQIAEAVRSSFYGKKATKFRAEEEERDIFIKVRDLDREHIDDVGRTPIRLPGGGFVPLSSIAAVRQRTGPLEIDRRDRQRIVTVQAGLTGKRDYNKIRTEIEEHFLEINTPGVTIEVGGQREEMESVEYWFKVAIIVGIALVYMVMASQFESLKGPFIIMFSMPFAFTGVLWALFIRGFNLGLTVYIGILMLVGIVVNNAIVLVDYINILRARGRPVHEAVILAGTRRLRPVLMTALTTCCALIPMAFTRGVESEAWNPLGTTVLFGLLVSTVMTLVIIPTLYSVFERTCDVDGENA